MGQGVARGGAYGSRLARPLPSRGLSAQTVKKDAAPLFTDHTTISNIISKLINMITTTTTTTTIVIIVIITAGHAQPGASNLTPPDRHRVPQTPGRSRFGSIRFGSGLFEHSSVRLGLVRFGSVRPVRFGFLFLPELKHGPRREAQASMCLGVGHLGSKDNGWVGFVHPQVMRVMCCVHLGALARSLTHAHVGTHVRTDALTHVHAHIMTCVKHMLLYNTFIHIYREREREAHADARVHGRAHTYAHTQAHACARMHTHKFTHTRTHGRDTDQVTNTFDMHPYLH